MGSGKVRETGAIRTGSVLRGPAWPADVSAAWHPLWALAPGRHAFNGPAWTAAWAASRGAGLDLFAPVVRAPDRILGILPLVRDPDGVLRFHGRPECDYADLLASPEAGPEVLEQSLRALLVEPGWRRAELDNVREDGVLAAAVDRLPPDLRRLVAVERQAACPAVVSPPEAEGVFAALAAKDKLRQYHRKLGRLGEVRFRHVETREEIRELLPRFFRQHEERSVLAGRDSQFREPGPRRFYEALVDSMDPASELRFGVLHAGERLAACHFGFEANGRFLFYKPTFDVSLWDYSPGQVLLRALFQYAEARRVAVFDFTIGDEEYKHRFANEVVHTVRITVARSGPGATAAGVVRTARARLREVPALRSLVTRLRRRTGTPAPSVPLLAYRPDAAVERSDPAAGVAGVVAERGGLADLAGLSLANPAAFPSAAIPPLRLRLKQDELWVARRDGAVVAAAWCGERDAPAASPGTGGCRVLYDAWTVAERDRGPWFDAALAAARAGRPAELPVLVLVEDGSPLAAECVQRGWPRAGPPGGFS